jgi:hypothetical protein
MKKRLGALNTFENKSGTALGTAENEFGSGKHKNEI